MREWMMSVWEGEMRVEHALLDSYVQDYLALLGCFLGLFGWCVTVNLSQWVLCSAS